MENFKKFNLTFRLVLVGFIILSLAVSGLALTALILNTPEDYIFSLIVICISIAFSLFEITLTLIKIKKPLVILKIGLTERNYINPIPMIAVAVSAFLGLGVSIFGLVTLLIKEDIVIKCNAFVVLAIGFFLLLNCIFYLIVVPTAKKKFYK